MRKTRPLPIWLPALVLAGMPLAIQAAAPQPVVEYVHGATGNFLVTLDVGERVRVETGAIPELTRTGGQFSVWANESDDPRARPVCRFVSPGGPKSGSAHLLSIDPAECDSARGSGRWLDAGIAFYAAAAGAYGCAEGTTAIWRVPQSTDSAGLTRYRYTAESTLASRTGKRLPTPAFCAPLSDEDREQDARRLLLQASFGPTPADLAEVVRLGPAEWVDRQLRQPVTAYTAYPAVAATRPSTCIDDRTLPLRPDSFCARDNYTLFPLQTEFFRHALSQPDQLRGRVAWALSQIFVVSGLDNGRNYAVRHYQQMLRDYAFGNYLDLLREVTLSPVMGDYLDMVNNAKETANTTPNENYAREILQLFSIGLYYLNQDGTPQRDAQGKLVPTYDLDEIEGFARVFTGWTYPTAPGAADRNVNPRYYVGSMRAVDANHEFGAKSLLDGIVAQGGMTMAQDLDFALRNIFLHENVAPFISQQLIQRLVTSNPSPGYVERIAAVFDNNGIGRRGDMAAVVRAILLDPEARGARKIDPAYGKLTEPAVWMTRILRAFGGRSDGVALRAQSATLSQPVFYSPSVFNYFSPQQAIPGTSLLGPEFGILGTSTAIARANTANTLVYSTLIPPDATVYGATGTALDFTGWLPTAASSDALVERIDRELMNRRLTLRTKTVMRTAIEAVPAADPLNRVRAAAWLAVTSPQFSVER